jgi:hypothetical protein
VKDEESSRGSTVGSVTTFAWRNFGKSHRTTVWIADMPTKVFQSVREVCRSLLTLEADTYQRSEGTAHLYMLLREFGLCATYTFTYLETGLSI